MSVFTCRAALLWGLRGEFVMEEVEVHPPRSMEIRIKVFCTSICRRDLIAWESLAHTPIYPQIFGHKATGIVESVGQEVSEFEVGDHVHTLFMGECMGGRNCSFDMSNICQELGSEMRGVMHSDQTTRFSVRGRPIYQYCAVPIFSEYTVVPTRCAVKVDSRAAPLKKICLVSCCGESNLADWKVAHISKGSTVVIFGLGDEGISVVQGAKSRGASQIIGVDTSRGRCQNAKNFGLTSYVVLSDFYIPLHQVIKDLTNGRAHCSVECIGDPGMITTTLESFCEEMVKKLQRSY